MNPGNRLKHMILTNMSIVMNVEILETIVSHVRQIFHPPWEYSSGCEPFLIGQSHFSEWLKYIVQRFQSRLIDLINRPTNQHTQNTQQPDKYSTSCALLNRQNRNGGNNSGKVYIFRSVVIFIFGKWHLVSSDVISLRNIQVCFKIIPNEITSVASLSRGQHNDCINTLRPRQNGCHFTHGILKLICC